MSMPRIFLCGITSAGNEANLRALIEPINEHLNGIQFTFHHPTDAGAAYLESRKGDGAVVYANWCQRHGYSMQHYLWQGTMQEGDYFLQLDSAERVSTAFMTEKLPQFIALMEEAEVGMVANYGKGFIFRYHEQLRFEGSPHWYPVNVKGRVLDTQLDKSHFWNVRHQQRADDQWIEHYAKYWIYPEGSNHAALGLDHWPPGDRNAQFTERETRRLEFRRLMRARGVPQTVDGLKQLLTGPLDEELKAHCRAEKTLSDALHHWAGRTAQLKHSHNPADALPIP